MELRFLPLMRLIVSPNGDMIFDLITGDHQSSLFNLLKYLFGQFVIMEFFVSRRLSVLRETFQVQSLPGLKDHIPILALTATATNCVEVDILNSLKINNSTARIVRTTLFRPNLRFSVSLLLH